MSQSKQTKHVTAALPIPAIERLTQHAELQGISLHALLVRVLVAHSKLPFPPPLQKAPHEDELTETIVVELPLQLAMRLHTTARQMRTPTGAVLAPAVLVRQLLNHYFLRKSDVLERMRLQVDPTYHDVVPFTQTPARLRKSKLVTWYPIVLRIPYPTREAIAKVARTRGTSLSGLMRTVLDKVLPHYPYLQDEQAAPAVPTARAA